MLRIRTLLGALLAIAMLATACTSDAGDTAVETEPTEAAEAEPDEVMEEDEPDEVMEEDEPVEAEPADDPEPAEDPAAAGVAAAAAVVEANSVPASAIGPTIPLDSVPEAKTIAWLECALPSCAAIGVGFADAAAAIGWNLEVIPFNGGEEAPAFQQAIDLGVDYISITGTAPALIQDQIDAAADAGIPIFSCFDTADPGGDDNNIWMQCGDETQVFAAGALGANTIIADSGGDANILMVNIPDFAVLVEERLGMEAAIAENCPGCSFNELALTLDQLLAGEVSGAVVSAIQADPDVDYIHLAFDGLHFGLSTTLEEADLLEGRKIAGVDFSGAIAQEIVNGTHAFWNANPKPYAAWLMVDGMARHSIGQDNTEERSNAVMPTFVLTDELAESMIAGDGWPGPDDMDAQFMALWGVG